MSDEASMEVTHTEFMRWQNRIAQLEAERDEAREQARMSSFMGEGYAFVEKRAMEAEARADAAEAKLREAVDARDKQQAAKDGAYEERNRLVALLASMFPSGVKQTNIPGWNPEWHGAVYIDFPWGQASWHFHVSQAHLFSHLPPYAGEWDGHTTEGKYEAIASAARARLTGEARG